MYVISSRRAGARICRLYHPHMLRAVAELLERVDQEQRALGHVDMEPHLLHLMLRTTIEALFDVGNKYPCLAWPCTAPITHPNRMHT